MEQDVGATRRMAPANQARLQGSGEMEPSGQLHPNAARQVKGVDPTMSIQIGEVIVHPEVEHALGQCGQHVQEFVDRFAAEDFGDIDAEIHEFNQQALKDGDCDVVGIYQTCGDDTIYVISNGNCMIG